MKYVFIFTNLEPYPLPDCLNEKLKSNSDICFVHLFYKNQDSTDLSFLSSFKSVWKNLYASIDHELALKELPIFQIKVGILSTPNTMPELQNGQTFFSTDQSYIKGRRIMTIIVSSHPDRKIFIQLVNILMHLSIYLIYSNYCIWQREV